MAKPFLFLLKHERLLATRINLLGMLLVGLCAGVSLFIYLAALLFPQGMQTAPQAYSQILCALILISFPYFAFLGFGGERRAKTLDVLFAMPLPAGQLAAAKLLVWLGFSLPLLAMALFWFAAGKPWYFFDFGVFAGSMLQILLTVLFSVSSALCFSAFFLSAWNAAIVSQIIALGMLLASVWQQNLPPASPLFAALSFFSYSQRTEALRKGAINSADLAFFLGFSLLFVWLAVTKLNLLRGVKAKRLPIAAVAGAFLWLAFPWRFDMTFHQTNSLSRSSRHLLDALNAPLYLTYYVSEPLIHNGSVKNALRLLKSYEKLHKQVYVELASADSGALQAGLRPLAFSQSSQDLFAGVFIEYKDKAIAIPQLIDEDEVEYRVSTALYRLFNGKKTIVLIGSPSRPLSMFSFLRASLKNQFELAEWNYAANEPLPAADAYFLLADEGLNAAQAMELLAAHKQGAGLFAALSPVSVPLFSQEQPRRLPSSPFANLLQELGLTSRSNLILDPDGAVLRAQSGTGALQQNYPAWPLARARKGGQPLFMLFSNLNMLYSSPLWINEEWQALAYSSSAAYEQSGVVDISPQSLAEKPASQPLGPYALAARHLKSEAPLIVTAADAAFSDAVEAADAWRNIASAELLGWVLTGENSLAGIKTRFASQTAQQKPFALHEDALVYTGHVLSSVVALALCLILMFAARSK